ELSGDYSSRRDALNQRARLGAGIRSHLRPRRDSRIAIPGAALDWVLRQAARRGAGGSSKGADRGADRHRRAALKYPHQGLLAIRRTELLVSGAAEMGHQ